MRVLLCVAAALALQAQDPKEIIKRSMERDARNLTLLDTYIYESKTRIQTFDKNGRVEETIENADEVFHVDGSRVERHLVKKGKALTGRDDAAEQKRVDREIAKIKSESPKERAKRRGETEKDKREEIEARREISEAYDFKLIGSQKINGRLCWGLEGAPRPGFQGRGRRADQLKKLKGKVWIDQATYELVKLDLDSIDTISFGWFIFRLSAGARIELEQALVNNEVWLPQRIGIRADARILGKLKRVGIDIGYSKFRKFSSDSKLVVAEP